jgi:hypothetical protein
MLKRQAIAAAAGQKTIHLRVPFQFSDCAQRVTQFFERAMKRGFHVLGAREHAREQLVINPSTVGTILQETKNKSVNANRGKSASGGAEALDLPSIAYNKRLAVPQHHTQRHLYSRRNPAHQVQRRSEPTGFEMTDDLQPIGPTFHSRHGIRLRANNYFQDSR